MHFTYMYNIVQVLASYSVNTRSSSYVVRTSTYIYVHLHTLLPDYVMYVDVDVLCSILVVSTRAPFNIPVFVFRFSFFVSEIL